MMDDNKFPWLLFVLGQWTGILIFMVVVSGVVMALKGG
jgi:hypothetical protein